MRLPKTYEPNQYEKDIYELWEKAEAFKPGTNKDTYTVIMPPPNANASLHAGHSLTYVIQDIAVRYNRMKGKSALWLPGADHAGFETQVVYEKQLEKEGKSRFDFSRDELYQQIWDFVQKNKSGFQDQLRRLGASCDWSRFSFTLDDKVIKTAYSSFKKMWDEELIYRGERLVNFCTFHGTSFSDIEVVHRQEQSKLWHIKYLLTDGSGSITVATTRPETMFGDTAVAVHPDDARYKAFHGKTVKLPLTQREIPIITDEMVDKDFGSGAVKITPAHDPNDYEVALRHDLPMVTIISHEGTMTPDVPDPYRGLEIKKARELVAADLKDQGLLEKAETYTHSVGHCYKCDSVIEPLLRDQWFVDMKPLATNAVKALREGKITFYPATKKDEVIRYLKGVRDWNISRQIAWGIPIPAFQNVDDPDDWIYDERISEETITVDGKTYHRDPDVFDTWFSSGQWPYITLGYPGNEDFKRFYPTDLMETGVDILFQWVSRMICLGLYITGDVPFKEVYLHGMVRGVDGRKMSKSLGNVIPLEDTIAQYGADALRLGIVAGRSPASSGPYSPEKILAGRNFANKLWNVARFIEGKIGDDFNAKGVPKPETSADYWILHKLQHSTEVAGQYIEQYRFSEAYELIYHTLWDDFADWYIEASKSKPNNSVLAYGLETILKVAHPFAPFVTETIWQTLKWEGDSLLITAPWPTAAKSDDKKGRDFEQIQAIVSEIRYVKGVMRLRGGLTLYHAGEAFLNEQAGLIKRMAGLEDIKEVRDGHGLHLTSTSLKCWLDIDQETAQRFLEQLKTKLAGQKKTIERLEGRLGNKAYVKNAPKELVEETREQLEQAAALAAKLQEEYARFASATE